MISAGLKKDIERFLAMNENHLEWVLGALCQFRSSDADLVEMLADHISSIDTKNPVLYCYLRLGSRYNWIWQYPHHVKAITLASIKHNQVDHPDLVRQLLDTNNHITSNVLYDVLEGRTQNFKVNGH